MAEFLMHQADAPPWTFGSFLFGIYVCSITSRMKSPTISD
jgi:hypothetical protein